MACDHPYLVTLALLCHAVSSTWHLDPADSREPAPVVPSTAPTPSTRPQLDVHLRPCGYRCGYQGTTMWITVWTSRMTPDCLMRAWGTSVTDPPPFWSLHRPNWSRFWRPHLGRDPEGHSIVRPRRSADAAGSAGIAQVRCTRPGQEQPALELRLWAHVPHVSVPGRRPSDH